MIKCRLGGAYCRSAGRDSCCDTGHGSSVMAVSTESEGPFLVVPSPEPPPPHKQWGPRTYGYILKEAFDFHVTLT